MRKIQKRNIESWSRLINSVMFFRATLNNSCELFKASPRPESVKAGYLDRTMLQALWGL